MNETTEQKRKIIDIIAPASAVDKSVYNSCLKFLKDSNLQPRASDYASLINKEAGFCANNAEYRFNDLYKAIMAEDSSVIWCIAGGYGSYQLLEMLDNMPKPQKQKTFIGFSDVTALLNYFVDKWSWKCLHAPMLNQIVEGKVSSQSIKQIMTILSGDLTNIELGNLECVNKASRESGKIEGKIIGGCLSLMQVFLGTKQDLDYKDKILLLEDDKFETPARISRIFNHMVRAGVFDKVKAVILGSFLEDKQDSDLQLAFDYLKVELDKRNTPILRAANLGHCFNMQPVTLGTDTVIELGESPKIKINN